MEYVSRPSYEARLKKLRGSEDIKVLTGVRRCGKSSLLNWLKCDLVRDGVSEVNVFYRCMDMFGMPVNPDAEWLIAQLSQAIEISDQDKRFFVLLD